MSLTHHPFLSSTLLVKPQKSPVTSPKRQKNPIDSSCIGIEAEDLGCDTSEFDCDLRSDMAAMTFGELKKTYPELDFLFLRGKNSVRPRGHDYCQWIPGGWRVGDWRKV